MQMWCFFIQMHDRIKYPQIRVSLLESHHIFFQCQLGINTLHHATVSIIPVAYLDNQLMEQFFLFACTDFFIVIVNPAVCPALFGIIGLQCLIKECVIHLFNIFFHINFISFATLGIYIFCRKCPVIMIQRTFPHHH